MSDKVQVKIIRNGELDSDVEGDAVLAVTFNADELCVEGEASFVGSCSNIAAVNALSELINHLAREIDVSREMLLANLIFEGMGEGE
ncbi:hypothetical protein [Gordonibacter urolithinfaciens]|uniref:hypothetical protein n=1 Tax=Gordonibacter urolithinfaciens TaxID=1335613 RepID=UPI0034A760C7